MKFSEASRGRVFILRLEQGEVIHEALENFAAEHGVSAAALLMVGAVDSGSNIVCGPLDPDSRPIEPLRHSLPGVHEMTGVGTLFPDEDGKPMLHIHAAFGREGKASAGCVRGGVVVWQVLEVIMFELTGSSARKVRDADTGFEILEP
jgi:predicted DNA-binding protein with PD1-like motif